MEPMKRPYEYIVEKIPLEEVLADTNKEFFNSNNHRLEDQEKPDDYTFRNQSTQLEYWISSFRNNYKLIEITNKNDLTMLRNLAKLYLQTNHFSAMIKEELQDLTEKYEKLYDHLDLSKGYFIRAENVSLKYGIHKNKPYSSIQQIFESSVTCPPEHSPIFNDNPNLIRFYLFPWMEVNHSREFRVFVHQSQITAISQQFLHEKNEFLSNIVDEDERIQVIHQWMDSLIEYYDKDIKGKITHITEFSMDMAILEDNQPYLIEINPFGKEYSAGSALFHWLRDETKLYRNQPLNVASNDSLIVYFRYTV
jgi:hypothetical protein